MSCYLHVSFLESCKSYGLSYMFEHQKKLFIKFESDDFIIFWKETLLSADNDLLDALSMGTCKRMFTSEKRLRQII